MFTDRSEIDAEIVRLQVAYKAANEKTKACTQKYAWMKDKEAATPPPLLAVCCS